MGKSAKEPLQSRRHFLATILEAGLSAPKSWAQEKTDAIQGIPKEARRKTPVSPPGSVSHLHLNATCDGCGLCIQHCPTHVLRSSVSEYGPEYIGHPLMDFSSGWCDYECVKCGETCPKGAIKPLDIDTKQSVQVGSATLVKSLCINNLSDTSCSVCADVCPASAIKMKEDYNLAMVEIDGVKKHRVFPEIEDVLCIGCGLCENKCPSSGASAIHIEGLIEHID